MLFFALTLFGSSTIQVYCNQMLVVLQEELTIIRRRLERSKKMEKASTADEVLFEEIRELKVRAILFLPCYQHVGVSRSV